ncbi:hypothetical protein [Chitinophaga barathri]|uniref:Uncharacterized protein n=1 Tax=Chitinophaga barathri TaxID=1647451 RepID=A0A3N4M7U2_9BACT|nr:hypothetical protein [Chitinophaga barathri]RPD39378.1 hypothetical protein EG028_19840 [Chitinophaga barathri]
MGLIRLSKIRVSYQPFMLFLLLAFTAEMVGFITVKIIRNNYISTNVYTLVEAIVIACIFYAWGFFREHKLLFRIVLVLYAGVWVTENLIFGDLENQICSYFIFLYSLITVLLSINEINYLIAERGNLFKNARFLICIGFIIICVYSLITEGTQLIDPDNAPLSNKIFTFYVYINAFVNIVYAVAVYFMPERDDIYFSKRFNA